MSMAYDLPRLWNRALSQPILDTCIPQEQWERSASWRRQVQKGGNVSVTALDTGPGTQGA